MAQDPHARETRLLHTSYHCLCIFDFESCRNIHGVRFEPTTSWFWVSDLPSDHHLIHMYGHSLRTGDWAFVFVSTSVPPQIAAATNVDHTWQRVRYTYHMNILHGAQECLSNHGNAGNCFGRPACAGFSQTKQMACFGTPSLESSGGMGCPWVDETISMPTREYPWNHWAASDNVTNMYAWLAFWYIECCVFVVSVFTHLLVGRQWKKTHLSGASGFVWGILLSKHQTEWTMEHCWGITTPLPLPAVDIFNYSCFWWEGLDDEPTVCPVRKVQVCCHGDRQEECYE